MHFTDPVTVPRGWVYLISTPWKREKVKGPRCTLSRVEIRVTLALSSLQPKNIWSLQGFTPLWGPKNIKREQAGYKEEEDDDPHVVHEKGTKLSHSSFGK